MNLLKNPKAAEKLVKECEVLEKKAAAHLAKLQATTGQIAKKLDSTYASIISMNKDVNRILKIAKDNWPD